MEASTIVNGTSYYYNLLISFTRDFLISSSGAQVKVEELEGRTIGLYFSANWFTQCQTFTPILADIYNQLKEQGSNIEIVFVSSDEDQISFTIFIKPCHGWLFLSPIYNLRIPSLVIVDEFGEPIQAEGVELIYRYGVQAFPFTSKANQASQTIEKLLSTHARDYVISKNEQVPVAHLVGKTVGLYFSASWCPPCVKFTPRLASVYDSLRDKKLDFEIVFISLDRDEEGYLSCWESIVKLILKVSLRYFSVQAIPCLIIIGPDGKTVTKEGRNLINLHLDMAYPFTEAQLLSIQEKIDEEAKSYPKAIYHSGHKHELNLVSASSGGGPFICCECDEQGSGWGYQCIECGYEIHLKCAQQVDEDEQVKKEANTANSYCACNGK
ncbi:hypothetical protein MKX01_022242 [Papaver californicum]|nr:hypothetical protein MKX01_022242 [Papaver californicum]